MNGKGRKLFRSAVGILTSVMMMGAYTTTAMASGIGVIDAKDMLDIHAEANTASAVVGQVMEDGHVAILAKYNDWVQIQAWLMSNRSSPRRKWKFTAAQSYSSA